MKTVKYEDVRTRVQFVKELIESAGNRIFSVWFVKRGDGKLRKMSARRHVRKPSYAQAPTGKISYKRKMLDRENNLMTVFSTNDIRYNKQGKMCGRGAWKSLPLDSIKRIKVGGEIYKIV